MNYKEIIIANPITGTRIDTAFEEIKTCHSELLLIDVGEHYFESVAVLKYFKDRFTAESKVLAKFKKIAFLHPPSLRNESADKERYNYFTSREKAIAWLTSTHNS